MVPSTPNKFKFNDIAPSLITGMIALLIFVGGMMVSSQNELKLSMKDMAGRLDTFILGNSNYREGMEGRVSSLQADLKALDRRVMSLETSDKIN